MENKHKGSSFDSFLEVEDLLEHSEAVGMERISETISNFDKEREKRMEEEALALWGDYMFIYEMNIDDSQELPYNTSEQKLFWILVVQFISGKPTTLLDKLLEIIKNPLLGKKDIDFLRESVNAFNEWLNHKVWKKRSWRSTLDEYPENDILKITRKDMIKICGTASKHDIGNLTGIKDNMLRVFNDNMLGAEKIENINHNWFVILDDFITEFFEDDLVSHYHKVKKMISDIRYGIFCYIYSLPLYIEGHKKLTENKNRMDELTACQKILCSSSFVLNRTRHKIYKLPPNWDNPKCYCPAHEHTMI